MEKFGALLSAYSLTGGDPTKYHELMAMEYEFVMWYKWMAKEQGEYQEDYYELKSKNNK